VLLAHVGKAVVEARSKSRTYITAVSKHAVSGHVAAALLPKLLCQ